MTNLSIPIKILKSLETSSSIGMFAKDTGGTLAAKLSFARSNDEAKELSFSEISESLLFYFSAPALAKATTGLFSKVYKTNKEIITTPINELKSIDSKSLKNIKLGKFGKIASVFSVILPLIFAVPKARNIMTYSRTGKTDFTAVVGLNKDKAKNHKQDAKQRSKKLLKNTMLITATGLTTTGIILKAGKSNKGYKLIEPILNKIIKYFDFTKTGDLNLAHYAALIFPVSIASYLNSSRDKYERNENIRRFSVTVPMLLFGTKVIEKPLYKTFDKKFGTKVMENGKIKSYEDILKMSENTAEKYLKTKNIACGLNFSINTLLIAAAIALLNRTATKKAFEKDNKKQNKINPYNLIMRNISPAFKDFVAN